MFENYAPLARRAIFFARHEAAQAGSDTIETEHLLLALLTVSPLGLSKEKIESMRARIAERRPPGPKKSTSVDIPISEECKEILESAERIATEMKHGEITPTHLLLGLMRVEGSLGAELLRGAGVTDVQFPFPAPPAREFRDLTREALDGRLGPLIGRERELERIVEILARRTRNHAVLVGEAGVGKTAILEGFAQVSNRRVLAIDAAMIGVAKKRGREIFESAGNDIICVEGLFDIAAAGAWWSEMEAVQFLEPILQRGEVRCIATGTPLGFRATLVKSPLLARRFEAVFVAEPNEEETGKILEGVQKQYETFHGVTIGADGIEAAIQASRRFLTARHLPDRALDLLDEACSRVKLRNAASTVGRGEIEMLVADRTGAPLAAIQKVMQETFEGEYETLLKELERQAPVELREWAPFLATWLANLSANDAQKLASAIRELGQAPEGATRRGPARET